jgi:Beta-propeller repeat
VRLNRRRVGAGFSGIRVLLALVLLIAAGVAIVGLSSSGPAVVGRGQAAPGPALVAAPPLASARTSQAAVPYGHLPLIFEANRGQSDARVKFLARGSGYGLFLTEKDAVLVLQPADRRGGSAEKSSTVRMQLAGSSAAEVSAAGELPGKSNYLIGNNPARWHRNVPQFARVRYHSVYPGIDLVYYGNQGRLEYDFEVAPGADPGMIKLRFEGPQRLTLKAGDVVLTTPSGQVRFEAPRIYQKIGDERKPVAGRFVRRGNDAVGFELAAYDRTHSLVIDPVLTYSTYLGGSGAESCSAITGATFTPHCPAIALDASGNVYIAGATTSTVGFPNPAGVASSNTVGGPADVFITKLVNSGSALAFTTYLGGDGTDTPVGIAVDAGFNVVVAGTTSSTNFPVTMATAYQTAPKAGSSGTQHVFVTQLDPSGSSQLYSTYLSGNGNDTASGLALDVNGKAYVIGTTTSTDTPGVSTAFPATVGAFQTASVGANQFFVTKVDPASSGLQSVPYSTYFGGGTPANGVAMGGGIAVDSGGNVYITGGTNFLHTGANATLDFPVLNAAQGCLDVPSATAPITAITCPTNVTALDAFVAKINPAAATGSQLIYSTYLGGTGSDVGYGIAVDSGGLAYVTGSTTSTDFVLPSGPTPFQIGNNGGTDAFVAKFSNFLPPVTGTTSTVSVAMTYFSYLGGSGDDTGTAVVADSVQGARVTGWTDSTNFPTQTPLQATSGGGRDAFVARIDTTGLSCIPSPPTVNCPSNSSYLGGSGTDMGTSIALDLTGAAYLAGETASANFPLQAPLQNAFAGTSDAFITKLGPTLNLAMTATASPSPVGVGGQINYTYSIVNNGDLVTGLTFVDSIQGAGIGTTATATAQPGSCGTANSGTLQCNIGTLNTTPAGTSGASVTVSVTPTSAFPNGLGNSALLSAPGLAQGPSASATAIVNDFNISVGPASQTVAAGGFVPYTVTVTPTGGFPGSVSLAVGSGLPTGASSTFTTSSIPNLNNGPVSTVLNVNTTARVTTTVDLRRKSGPWYAIWLPVCGLAFLGVGVGGTMSRKRRWLMGLLLCGFFVLILLQPSCGSSPATTTTTGTPAGTYTLTINATSGSVTRTTTVQLVVQ